MARKIEVINPIETCEQISTVSELKREIKRRIEDAFSFDYEDNNKLSGFIENKSDLVREISKALSIETIKEKHYSYKNEVPIATMIDVAKYGFSYNDIEAVVYEEYDKVLGKFITSQKRLYTTKKKEILDNLKKELEKYTIECHEKEPNDPMPYRVIIMGFEGINRNNMLDIISDEFNRELYEEVYNQAISYLKQRFKSELELEKLAERQKMKNSSKWIKLLIGYKTARWMVK